MNARFVRGAQTRLRIIRAAADLFHQKGARGTSPDEVIDASQTGKGQFYHYFGSKEGLVHAVLQTYLEAIKTGSAVIDYEISSWRDLEDWFRAHLKLQMRYQMTRGCPFGRLANEVAEHDEFIRQDISLIFEVVKQRLAAFFLKEKVTGRLARRADPQQLADFCIETIQGAMLMGKINRSSQTVEACVRAALDHLKSHLVRARR